MIIRKIGSNPTREEFQKFVDQCNIDFVICGECFIEVEGASKEEVDDLVQAVKYSIQPEMKEDNPQVIEPRHEEYLCCSAYGCSPSSYEEPKYKEVYIVGAKEGKLAAVLKFLRKYYPDKSLQEVKALLDEVIGLNIPYEYLCPYLKEMRKDWALSKEQLEKLCKQLDDLGAIYKIRDFS